MDEAYQGEETFCMISWHDREQYCVNISVSISAPVLRRHFVLII